MTDASSEEQKLEIGRRLKEARDRLGLSVEEAAEKLGITRPQSVRDYEEGGRECRYLMLIRFCRAYGRSADWILGLSRKPEIPGGGWVLDLEVESAINRAKSWSALVKIAKKLDAYAEHDNAIEFADPVPPEFEVLSDEEYRLRAQSLRKKMERLRDESSQE